MRLIDGGPVSSAPVRSARVGARLRLGPPIGLLVLDDQSGRPLLLVGGGTGLAPLKALVEQVAADVGRRTQLLRGAHGPRNLRRRRAQPAGTRPRVVAVRTMISDEDRWDGARGMVGEVALAQGEWTGHEVYVCGSPAMVEATVKLFVAHGVPEQQIRFDEFGES